MERVWRSWKPPLYRESNLLRYKHAYDRFSKKQAKPRADTGAQKGARRSAHETFVRDREAHGPSAGGTDRFGHRASRHGQPEALAVASSANGSRFRCGEMAACQSRGTKPAAAAGRAGAVGEAPPSGREMTPRHRVTSNLTRPLRCDTSVRIKTTGASPRKQRQSFADAHLVCGAQTQSNVRIRERGGDDSVSGPEQAE